jgi:hypothetical protein
LFIFGNICILFFGQHSFEQPRYLHPHFKEVTTRAQLNRAQRAPPPLAAAMMRLNMPQAELSADSAVGSDAPKAEDYLSALREARRSKLASNSEAGGDGTTSAPPTLAERLEARLAAQGNDDGQRSATEAKNKEVDVASVRNILKDQASKAEFVKKMSRTFGYGMPSNAEPKTDTLAAEAEKCALLVKSSKSRQKNHNSTTGNNNNRKSSGGEGQKSSNSSSNTKQPHKSRPSAEARKAAKAASSGSREREVQPWDFGKDAQQQQLHSSVAPLNPLIDIQIDPELDFLLAELEQDEDFAQLNENEQKTWLESLFFQDTLHCPGRMLVRLSFSIFA